MSLAVLVLAAVGSTSYQMGDQATGLVILYFSAFAWFTGLMFVENPDHLDWPMDAIVDRSDNAFYMVAACFLSPVVMVYTMVVWLIIVTFLGVVTLWALLWARTTRDAMEGIYDFINLAKQLTYFVVVPAIVIAMTVVAFV